MAETGGSEAQKPTEPEPIRRRKWHATFRTRFATLGLFISSRRNKPILDPAARFARLLVWMTGLLAFMVLAQTVTFVMSERAFLTVSSISPNPLPWVAGKPLDILLEIRNGGKTTAAIELLNVSVSFQGLPEEPQYGPGSQLFSAPILPGTPTHFGLGSPTIVPTAEQINSIINGTTKFFVFGFVRYTDEFSFFGARETGFCYRYNPQGDPRSTVFTTCDKRTYVFARGKWGWSR